MQLWRPDILTIRARVAEWARGAAVRLFIFFTLPNQNKHADSFSET
jgi:hypothetical protein